MPATGFFVGKGILELKNNFIRGGSRLHHYRAMIALKRYLLGLAGNHDFGGYGAAAWLYACICLSS